MSGWKRVKDCLVCGRPRCMETEWMIYCFRDQQAYNKKQYQLGVGRVSGNRRFPDRILKDEILKLGVLEGKKPSNQMRISFMDSAEILESD